MNPKRIDHLLFQADTDFIAYFDTQPLPGGDEGIEPCECFARFVAELARAKKNILPSLNSVEEIMKDGGWNAEQLCRWFFPRLNQYLTEATLRAKLENGFGLRSRVEWERLQVKTHQQEI